MIEGMEAMILKKKIPTAFSFGSYFFSPVCRPCFSKQLEKPEHGSQSKYSDLYGNQENITFIYVVLYDNIAHMQNENSSLILLLRKVQSELDMLNLG